VCFLLTQIPKKVYHLFQFADATSVKQHLASVACHGGRGGQGKGCYVARVGNLIEVRPVDIVEEAAFDVFTGWREAGLGACPKGS
jgi:hypothetical protein